MDSISRSLVRPVEGPRGLLQQVVRAAGHHLGADWTVLALADGQLSSAGPRSMVADASGRVREPDVLPAFVRRELAAIRAGHLVRSDERWVRVPMSLEGRPIGSLSLNCGQVDLEPGDLSVLRILANQAGVSLHTAEQYRTGVALHHLAQRRYDEARPGQEPAVEVRSRAMLYVPTASDPLEAMLPVMCPLISVKLIVPTPVLVTEKLAASRSWSVRATPCPLPVVAM